MNPSTSIRFFESQFQRQVREAERALNPFEIEALPHLGGRVLDLGCGLGNLSIALAERGASVLALDASPTAIGQLRAAARDRRLPIEARRVDLRRYEITQPFDSIACIGLLMFFDRPTALRLLHGIQQHVRPGGVAAVNVLIEGTTYMEMFDPAGYCLFAAGELARRFAGWDLLVDHEQEFPAPGAHVKRFETLVARRPDPATPECSPP